MKTAEDLIQESIDTDAVVCHEWRADLEADLSAECEETYAISPRAIAYNGTDDLGAKWSVRLHSTH